MSDRTPGSVRSGSPGGDVAASKDGATGAGVPVTATQSIPGTGTQRAQSPTGVAAPTGAVASTGAVAPSGRATVPTTGVSAAAAGPAAASSFTSATSATSATAVEGRSAPDRPAARTASRPARSGRGPRRARLQLRHIDTWSALKISLILSIALFFMWMVAVGILYMVLDTLGVFDTLNDLFGQVGSVNGSDATGDVITPGVVFGGAAVIGAINVVLMTALCTVGTFIYNLCSDLVGGLEITLSERD
jgi:hypothetical protein